MPKGIREVAEAFVDLVLQTCVTAQISNDAAIPVIFDLVSAAGFGCSSVLAGQIKHPLYDREGNPVSEMQTVNKHCPYKVLGLGDGLYEEATLWADNLFSSVQLGHEQRLSRDQLIGTVVMAIEENIPFEPILLNPQGEMFSEIVTYRGSKAKHTRDSDRFPQRSFGQASIAVGFHSNCESFILRTTVSATHDVLFCQKCNLRLHVKKDVDTYGKLRAALAEMQKKQ